MNLLFKQTTYNYLLLFTVLIAAFFVRAVNLNYNSPFSDEAIYVVVGKLGLFSWDWWSYSASNWMAGSPFIYPSLTAIAYSLGGIEGTRLLSVLFSLLLTFSIYKITSHLTNGTAFQKNLAGFLAASISAGTAVSIYVSRLATYDIPSFALMFTGLYLLLKAEKENENIGKLYLFGSILLLLSVLTKIIIAVFIPLIIIYTFLRAKNLGQNQLHYWKRYLLFPFLGMFTFYLLTNFNSILTYSSSQIGREKVGPGPIIETIWESIKLISGFFAIGIIGMMFKKEYKNLAFLSIAALTIIAVHILNARLATLDKHTLLTVDFFAIAAGIGITNLTNIFKFAFIKIVFISIVLAFLLNFWIFSIKDAEKYNHQWENTTSLQVFLEKNVKQGDKLLAEDGQAVILATYSKNNLFNNTTFDWFKYGELEGPNAYGKAIQDGYFDLIQLQSRNRGKDYIHTNIHEVVIKNMDGNYETIFAQDGFYVYRRVN